MNRSNNNYQGRTPEKLESTYRTAYYTLMMGLVAAGFYIIFELLF